MYTATEFAEHYREVTGNSERLVQQTATAPDFEGYFKRSFEQIDSLFAEEADGNQAR